MHPILSPHPLLSRSRARSARALATLASAASLLAATHVARAQSADADRFRPRPTTASTPSSGLVAGPAATTTLPPPPPVAQPTYLIMHSPALPPVDVTYPRGVFGFHGGVTLRTPETTDAGVGTGPSWGVMGGIQLSQWLEFDARYFGMYTGRGDAPSSDQRWLTHAAAGVIRLTAPTPYVRPFITAGAGAYVTSFAIGGTQGFSNRDAVAHSVYLGLPVGAGFDVLITRRFSLGSELVWHPLIGPRGATVGPTGAENMITGAMTFRFTL